MAKKKRWNYYIAVEFNYMKKPKEIRYVTDIDNAHRIARWDDGKEAMPMSLSCAEDIVFGLVCNYYKAFIVKAPCSFEFSNPKKENTDDEE